MSKFAPAALATYIDWLRQHLNIDVRPTHWYDYPYSRAGFLLATADFTTGGECGSAARSILVPDGIRHLGGALGHNELFFFTAFAPFPKIVPVYNDPAFAELPGMTDFIEAGRARDRAFWAEQERAAKASEAALSESELGRHVLAQRRNRREP